MKRTLTRWDVLASLAIIVIAAIYIRALPSGPPGYETATSSAAAAIAPAITKDQGVASAPVAPKDQAVANVAPALKAQAVILMSWPVTFENVLMVMAPIILSALILLAMVVRFRRIDKQLPVVDVGTLCALITLIYAALPAVLFVESGFQWSSISDHRLVEANASPADVAGLLWQVTAYLFALAASYSLLRGAPMPGPNVRVDSSDDAGWALLLIVGFGVIYKIWFQQSFGMTLSPSNAQLDAGHWMEGIPLPVAQVTHNIMGILRIAMLGIVAFVFARRDPRLATMLAVWLAIEGYLTVINAGPRTYLVALLLAAILCWHRLVRPIGPIAATLTAVATLVLILGYGYWRDGYGVDWTAATEFQVLMASGLHVAWARVHGLLGDIPWQVTFNEAVLPIPQQLLPFRKFDIVDWYVHRLGLTDRGLMLGLVAQSAIGFGLPEMIVRGSLLGAVLALVHRLCVRRAGDIAALVVYLWLCTTVYYTYRAGTFYIVTWAIYRVVPFCLLLWLFRKALKGEDPARTNDADQFTPKTIQ